jgi:hypothetical protein
VLAALLLGVALLAGCGSKSSSTAAANSTPASGATTASSATTASTPKPSYCAPLSDLEASVKALADIKVRQVGTNGLKAALKQVQSNAMATIKAVEGQFASQTAALKSSLNTLATTVKQLSQSPSLAQLGQVKTQISAVSTAAKSLVSGISPKCG